MRPPGKLWSSCLGIGGLKKVDGVNGEAFSVPARIVSQRRGKGGKSIGRERVRDDEDAEVGTLVVEPSQGELDEVISVSGHQAASLLDSALKLLFISEATGVGLMRAHCVYFCCAEKLRYSRA